MYILFLCPEVVNLMIRVLFYKDTIRRLRVLPIPCSGMHDRLLVLGHQQLDAKQNTFGVCWGVRGQQSCNGDLVVPPCQQRLTHTLQSSCGAWTTERI